MYRVPVRDIMQTRVITIGPDALAADAAELMDEHSIRRVPVIDEEGYLCGIVTDLDIVEAETAEGVRSQYEPGFEEDWLAVSDIMTRNVHTVGPETPVGELVALMVEAKVGGIPVVEKSVDSAHQVKVIGIVTETDVFQMIINAWRADEDPDSD